MNTLGKVSLILSLFCFLITFGLKLAFSGWMPYVSAGVGFGLFFLFFALIINFRFLKAVLKSESLHFLAKSALISVLVLAIAVTVNVIFQQVDQKVDITANKIHSLPKLTQAIVKALPEDLNFYYFHTGNEKVRGFEAQVQTALEPYQELNRNIHLQSYSVFQRPDLAKKFKVGDEESTLFAEYKGRIQRVTGLDTRAITNTLLKLTKPPKKIYFVQAHDERKIEDESTFGLKGVNDQLERLHYETASLDSLDVIPEDAAMLVMVGPRKPLGEKDRSILDAYLRNGGHLLVAADPGEDHQVNVLLNEFGVHLPKNFIFSQQAQATQSDLLVLTHKGEASHEVAQSLVPGQNPAFFISSSVEIIEDFKEDFMIRPVLEHLPNSVAREDIDPKSEVIDEGKQLAAVVAEGLTDPLFRLAVVGDSDFVTNQFYSRPGNFDFLISLVAFLSKDEDLLRLKIPSAETTYLILSQTQMNLYFLFFVLPFCLIFFVIAVFFKLRRLF